MCTCTLLVVMLYSNTHQDDSTSTTRRVKHVATVGGKFCLCASTVFIRIVAAAANRGRLLFEGSFYLFWRDTLAPIRWLVVSSCDRLSFSGLLFEYSRYYDRKTAAEPSQGCLLSCFCLKLTIVSWHANMATPT